MGGVDMSDTSFGYGRLVPAAVFWRWRGRMVGTSLSRVIIRDG
jgi:hypothetical protein